MALKVLHVAEVLPGGVGSYILEVASAQASVRPIGFVGVLGPEDQLASLGKVDAFWLRGFRRRKRGILALISLWYSLYVTIKEFRPDIIHLHSSFAGLVGRLVPRRGGKIIYTAHCWSIDPDRPSKFKSVFIFVEKCLAKLTDVIVNISPHEMIFLEDMGFSKRRMRLVVTGLDDKLPCDQAEKIGPLCLLFIGRFDYQKGYDILMREISVLDPALYSVIAAGAYSGEVPVAAKAPACLSEIGWVDRREIAGLLAACDAVVMPSRWEGMPIAALEAMRAGRAVIASSKGPFPFIVRNNETGLIVDLDKPGFLAQALRGMTREEFSIMGMNARIEFLNEFLSGRMLSELEYIYAEALGAS